MKDRPGVLLQKQKHIRNNDDVNKWPIEEWVTYLAAGISKTAGNREDGANFEEKCRLDSVMIE